MKRNLFPRREYYDTWRAYVTKENSQGERSPCEFLLNNQ